jgi:ABC-type transport system involved in cytochrome c biogenesis permease subunit
MIEQREGYEVAARRGGRPWTQDAHCSEKAVMGKCAITIVLLVLISVCSEIAAGERSDWNWSEWRQLTVVDGGRAKPLDTLARETLLRLTHQTSITDPDSGRGLDPTAWYLGMLWEWQGWDRLSPRESSPGQLWRGQYFQLHPADRWDRAPLLPVDSPALRSALGLDKRQRSISPSELSRARVTLTARGETQPFLNWAERLAARTHELNPFEREALQLAEAFWTYQDHRIGRRLLLPVAPGHAPGAWLPASQILPAGVPAAGGSDSALSRVRQLLHNVRAAYLTGSAHDFARVSAELLAELGTGAAGSSRGVRASALEVAYNRWLPFRLAAVLMFCALPVLWWEMRRGGKPSRVIAPCILGAAVVAMLVGLSLRIAITGRWPLANAYEVAIVLALGIVVLGTAVRCWYRERLVLVSAAAAAAVVLVLADRVPAAMQSNLDSLEPILRSNLGLAAHVLPTVLSFAAFALAWGLGNALLGQYLIRGDATRSLSAMSHLTVRLLQVGVLLLAAGMLSGAVWADQAWGRLWDWDPKEVWALLTLLGYLAIVQAQHWGRLSSFNLALMSVLGFILVLMTWHGVNVLLHAGRHSYGFGQGGRALLAAAVALQLCYAGAVWCRRRVLRGNTDIPAGQAFSGQQGAQQW